MLFTRINENERGFVFKNGKFKDVLAPGYHRNSLFAFGVEIQKVSIKENMFDHADLKQIVNSGLLKNDLRVLDLTENERALVWIDRRFYGIFGAGLYAFWTIDRQVDVEIFEVTHPRFEHSLMEVIRNAPATAVHLDSFKLPKGYKGLVLVDQKLDEVLDPGTYMFWKNLKSVSFIPVNTQEETQSVSGQELMTKDRVSLRVNADLSTQVVDPVLYHEANSNASNAIYRRTQLILREEIGKLELDELLTGKDSLNEVMIERVRVEAQMLGMKVNAFGIRDVILPGDMKALLNQVVEARKAAEASNITRREETASMRSQLNTAKLIEQNPTLMKIRELETLERVAQNGKLIVSVGDDKLTEKLTNLI